MNPTKRLRVRQIEREVNVPLPSAIRYAKELEEEGILKKEEMAEIMVYSADRSSSIFLLEKRLFNLKTLFDCGLIEFLKRELSDPNILLFGSYSRGEDVEKSDIDLFIESSEEDLDLDKFEKKLGKEIQTFFYKKISFVRNKELANNIVNGVILNGFLEVFK